LLNLLVDVSMTQNATKITKEELQEIVTNRNKGSFEGRENQTGADGSTHTNFIASSPVGKALLAKYAKAYAANDKAALDDIGLNLMAIENVILRRAGLDNSLPLQSAAISIDDQKVHYNYNADKLRDGDLKKHEEKIKEISGYKGIFLDKFLQDVNMEKVLLHGLIHNTKPQIQSKNGHGLDNVALMNDKSAATRLV